MSSVAECVAFADNFLILVEEAYKSRSYKVDVRMA